VVSQLMNRLMKMELVPNDVINKYKYKKCFSHTDTVTDVITTSTTVIGVSVLIGSLFFFPRPVRVFLFKTIFSCFSINILVSFLPRRLVRVDAACCGCGCGSSSIKGGIMIVSTGDEFFDFVLRPARRFGDGG
jgi:hypothetical protein